MQGFLSNPFSANQGFDLRAYVVRPIFFICGSVMLDIGVFRRDSTDLGHSGCKASPSFSFKIPVYSSTSFLIQRSPRGNAMAMR